MFHPRNDVKQLVLIVKASAVTTFAGVMIAASPALCQSSSPASKATSPKSTSAQQGNAVRIGVFDEAKLLQARSDFPALATRVLPQVVAKYKLTFVVTKQGLRWGGSKLPSVDVTNDVLALLRKIPPSGKTLQTLTAPQQAAAQRAYDALNDLGVALRLSQLNYSQYNERLITATQAFEKNIRGVPTGPLKVQLVRAQRAFLDIATRWNGYNQALINAELREPSIHKEFQRDIARQFERLPNDADEATYRTQAEGRRVNAQLLAEEKYNIEAAQTTAFRELEAAEKLMATYSPQ